MQFEQAQQTAERLGVTVRAIQKWANEGRIPGAKKVGREWMIPVGLVKPVDKVKISDKPKKIRMAMPLLNSSFTPGKCREYIDCIPDEDDRKIALGEYYYFSGQAELCAKTVEEYLDSEDESLRYSAALLCSFANLSRGHIHLARFAMDRLKTDMIKGLRSEATAELHAIGIFTATTATVLLHAPVPDIPPLEKYLKYLPAGLKLFACYVLAHKAYLEKNYEGCLAIAEMSIDLCPNQYPIPEIYCRSVMVMALMNLKRIDEAKNQMSELWKLAQPDDLIEALGEHHGLMQGMIEIFFKNDYPQDYKRIIDITYAYSAGWRKIHNPDTNHDVADNLTTMEFTIAMLYSRGWKVKEIALHIDFSEKTIRNHIQCILEKLHIKDKNELSQFMLK